MTKHSEKKEGTNIDPEIEKEEAIKELIYGYINVFSHYLLSRGESPQITDQPKEDFLVVIKKILEIIPIEDEGEKKSVQILVDGIAEPENLSYYDLATSLGLLDSAIETPLYKLRILAYREMEKNDPEVAKQYIRTIL